MACLIVGGEKRADEGVVEPFRIFMLCPAGVWEMASNHGRIIFCDPCDGITAASEKTCSGCGAEHIDVYR